MIVPYRPAGKDIRRRTEMSRKVKAVIFDQDGLMFDTERLGAEGWYRTASHYGIRVDEEFLRELRGASQARVKAAFEACYGTEIDYEAFREEKRRFSYRWIEEHGVPVKKGLKQLLCFLKSRGLPMAVATASSEEWTRRNLAFTGLEGYFDQLVFAGMVKDAKPDPAIFLLAAEKLGVSPEYCIVLEDSFNGIRAAAAGGFIPVMVPDLAEPTPEIQALLAVKCESLEDVVRLFENGFFVS